MADNRESSETYVAEGASGQGSRRSSTADGASYTGLERSTSDAAAGENTRRRPRPLQSGRFGSEAAVGQTSPEHQDRRHARRPTTGRRASSRQMPYRGQEFSVDDDPEEVDDDVQQQRQAKLSTGSTRKQSTVRRRTTQQQSQLRVPLVQSPSSESDVEYAPIKAGGTGDLNRDPPSSGEDGTVVGADEDQDEMDDVQDGDDEEGSDVSDTESFTLRDRQQAINDTHPFGIRVWKPALYKKSRSVEKNADTDIHSAPGGRVSRWLWFFNFTWTILFGWWMAVVAAVGGLICHIFAFAPGCKSYGKVLWGFSGYILYPFGKYLKLIQEERYATEDEGEGRSISEYEQWQSGALEEGRLFFGPSRSLVGRQRSEDDSEEEDESSSLLGRNGRNGRNNIGNGSKQKTKKRIFGRGKWNLGRVIYFIFFYGLLAPLLLLVSGICWLLVFSIPMARLTWILFDHLRRHPLSLEFHSDSIDIRESGTTPSSILLCTYRAVGTKYWKYTLDGTNIFLINLLGVVAFVIFDYWVLYIALGIEIWLTNTILVFLLALFSIIPLAYFIGQAVASISAQSTMGVGAAVNAFFSTIVEVFLYCVALKEGKAPLVEGSIIGSIFAGVLFLPGLSMCFGAIKRKTQRFNVRSAGVTSTMLLFAVIAAFGPTLFYQIFGSHEINCHMCLTDPGDSDCQRCYFVQIPALHDSFFNDVVRPYTWFAAALLFLSYIIGLFFTLRTHAAIIWHSELDEKRQEKLDANSTQPTPVANAAPRQSNVDYGAIPLMRQTTTGSVSKGDIRDSALYKRILGQSLRQVGIGPMSTENPDKARAAMATAELDESTVANQTSPVEPTSLPLKRSSVLAEYDNSSLIRQMAEMAAMAAAVAARDASHEHRKGSSSSKTQTAGQQERPAPQTHNSVVNIETDEAAIVAGETATGGHDAPNWGRAKSYVVLLTATVAYAVIAEILVNTVDAVLDNVAIDQKFLGITLFALVPNTTEFLNAISFAVNGNIALSMEIGSAYALQVCLLQIPALVLFSGIYTHFIHVDDVIDHTFSLIFPQWDMVTVILCVFLLSYMYGEGKSNYFKGSILILSYLVVLVGFYCTGFDNIDTGDSSKYSHRPARVMGSRTSFTRFRTNPSIRKEL